MAIDEKETFKVNPASFKGGFTWRTMLATLYSIFVFMPAMIWMYLMTGTTGAVSWMAVILFIELSRLFGSKLTKQEAGLLSWLSVLAVMFQWNHIQWLYQAYYRNSPIVELFKLKDYIPDWYAPPPDSGAFQARTFFHPSWILPIGIGVAVYILTALSNMCLGVFCRDVFVEVENLPFPIQQVTAQAILTLTQREKRRMDILTLSAIGGFIYGIVLYGIPMLTLAYYGVSMPVIPLPWIDFNQTLQYYLPGASLGLATSLSVFALGLVLPFRVILSMFIGSLGVYFFGNWLVVQYNLAPISWWEMGMTVAYAFQRSTLYFWASPLIGASLAVGLMAVVARPRIMIRAFKALGSPVTNRVRTDPFPPWLMVGGYLTFVISMFALGLYLAPGPATLIIYTIMCIVWTLFVSITGTMFIGVTGQNPFAGWGQFFMASSIYISGYEGYTLWFLPAPVADASASASAFKLFQLLEIDIKSSILSWFVLSPIFIIAGLYFTQVFWNLAPIPSAIYPGVEIYWPTNAIYQSLWITRAPGLFRPDWIAISFVIMSALYLISVFLPAFPLNVVSLTVGGLTPVPIATSLFIMGIVSLGIIKMMGREWFNANRSVLAAGLFLGEALAVVISVAIALILKSIWILPF